MRTKQEHLRDMALHFAPTISANNKREQEALEYYYTLLREIDYYCCDISQGNATVKTFWTNYLKPLTETIEEIISDELNHAELLHKMMILFGDVKANKS